MFVEEFPEEVHLTFILDKGIEEYSFWFDRKTPKLELVGFKSFYHLLTIGKQPNIRYNENWFGRVVKDNHTGLFRYQTPFIASVIISDDVLKLMMENQEPIFIQTVGDTQQILTFEIGNQSFYGNTDIHYCGFPTLRPYPREE